MIKNINFAKKFKMIHYFTIMVISLSLSFSCKSETENAFSNAVTKDLSSEVEIPTKDGRVDQSKMAKIEFKELMFDFGKVKEGDVVQHIFKFKNTGSKDLLLLYH